MNYFAFLPDPLNAEKNLRGRDRLLRRASRPYGDRYVALVARHERVQLHQRCAQAGLAGLHQVVCLG